MTDTGFDVKATAVVYHTIKGNIRKRGVPGLFFLKNGYTLIPSNKHTARAITLLIGQKHIVPVY